MNKKSQRIIMGLVVIVLTASAIWMVINNKKQTEKQITEITPVETVKEISNVFASGKISVVPVKEGEILLGNKYNVQLVIDGGDKNVNGMQTRVCYGPQLEIANIDTDVTATENNEIILLSESNVGDRKCVDIVVGASVGAELTSGSMAMANIKFQTVSVGEDIIEVIPEQTIVSGENPGATSNQIEMTEIDNLTYLITE